MNHVSNFTQQSFHSVVCRLIQASLALLLSLSVSILVCHSARADHEVARENLPESWQTDAELTDVFFLNRDKGWAVGAQGIILRTNDGGVTWNEISQLDVFVEDENSLKEKIRNLQAGRSTNTSGMTHQAERSLPIRCRFESVHFVDALNGWAAGGYRIPYMNRSRAVVMKTNDGGVSWKSVNGIIIPRLRKIHFLSRKRGWAVGESGNLFTSGLYFTSDGGQSWSSDNNQRTSGWTTAARFENDQIGIDAFGRLTYLEQRRSKLAVLVNLEDEQQISDLLMLDPKNGIAVGAKGTILRTANAGQSWQPLDLGNAAPVVSQIDFQTVAIGGDKLWFAGNPGSCLVSLDLKTGVTDVIRTPIQTRFNKLCFGDPLHGVAVGEFGVIVTTSDGGQSWTIRRGKNQSSALMFVSERSNQLPLALLSRYSTEESRICSAVVLQDSLANFELGRQAVERLGCSTSLCLQLESPVQQPSGISTRRRTSEIDADDFKQRLERLVKQIRIAKPMVIVCSSQQVFGRPGTEHSTAVLANTANLIREAIRLAADRSAYPEHQQAGLDRHEVSRFLSLDPLGTVSVDADSLLTRVGKRVVEATGLSRALLGKTLFDNDPARFQIEHLTSLQRMRNGDILSGLSRSTPIPERVSAEKNLANLSDIKNSTERSKNLDELAQFELNTPSDIQVWRSLVKNNTRSFSRDVGSLWLMQLTERYILDNELELAAQSAQLLSTQWTDSPYSLPATVWLANHYASEEIGQAEFEKSVREGRLDLAGRPSKASRIANQFVTKPNRQLVNGMTEMTWEPIQKQTPAELRYGSPHVASTNLLEEVGDDGSEPKEIPLPAEKPAVLVQRMRIAAKFLSSAAQRDPDLASSPWYQWTESQIGRRLGAYAPPTSTTINRLQALIKKTTAANEISAAQHHLENEIIVASKRELKLMGELKDDPSLITIRSDRASAMRIDLSTLSDRIDIGKTCLQIAEKPTLDGKLSEDFWQGILDTSENKNQIRFARDQEYLYLGVVCRKLPGVDYAWEKQSRPRDAELTRRDRIAIDLDLDRDYRTSFHFEIDHRGWVNEACSGNVSWNPDWYISQSENNSAWVIEAAIPLKAILSSQIPAKADKTVWAIDVARLTGQEPEADVSAFQVKAINASKFEFLSLSEE